MRDLMKWFQPPPEHLRPEAAVELQGVSFNYDGHRALIGVDLKVGAGERVAIVGPNGAGKTTLLRVVLGAARPQAGSVRVFGVGPGGHVCIAHVPQRTQVDWTFPVTVREVVMMGRARQIGLFRWPRGSDREVVRRALARVGLQDLAGEPIGELSGGQQQRVFLAQALAQEAEVILLDEPFTGLDLLSQEAILRFLDEVRRDGVTVLVATHDLNLAAERFDQVVLLNRRVVAAGTPRRVLTREHLLRTYGDHLHLLPEGDGLLVLTDTCCEGEEAPA